MFKQLKPALILLILLTLVTGVIYPLTVTLISQTFYSFQANGSLIERNGRLLGSDLIGQDFSSPQYFWGRPSATSGSPYNAFDEQTLTGSSGSNLGPLSKQLVEDVQKRVDFLRKADPSNTLPIPVDLVTSSASGLDPDVSVASANYQAARIAQTRGISESQVHVLIDKYTEPRLLGFLGEPRVNVLKLNLALDGIE